jgi:type II secretory pathway component GspD/PulD (secretin)
VVEEPNKVPALIRNRHVETVLVEDGTILDLAVSLQELGIFTIVPDEEFRNKSLLLFAFKGTLGNYLDALSSAYNISFNWKNGDVLALETSSDYILKVPQDESLVDEIKNSLESYGADDVHYSLQASTVSYKATSKEHNRIVGYVDKLSLNASVISLQASVVTVTLDEEKKKGFDWSSLELLAGNPNLTNIYSADSSTTTDTESGSTTGSNFTDIMALTGLSAGGASFSLAKGDLYFNAALSFLNTYGNTETRQSVLMKTLSGKETGIKSADAVPYIDDVGRLNNSNSNSSYSSSSTSVKTVDVGLELTLKPYYDAATEIVTIDLQLQLSTLLGFTELSAGNQVGAISYPRVQKQEFDDIIKLRAGEPVIVGGITFDSFTDNRTNPYFLNEYSTASKNTSVSRNAMFIVLRPTVTLFGNFEQDQQVVTKD